MSGLKLIFTHDAEPDLLSDYWTAEPQILRGGGGGGAVVSSGASFFSRFSFHALNPPPFLSLQINEPTS